MEDTKKAVPKRAPPKSMEALVPTFMVHLPKRAAEMPPNPICR